MYTFEAITMIMMNTSIRVFETFCDIDGFNSTCTGEPVQQKNIRP